MAESFLIQAGYGFAWNAAEDALDAALDWVDIGAGITNVTPEENEQVDQKYYYNRGGNATTDVIGKQSVWAFEGDRDYGDAFQNLVFETMKNKLGADRRGTLRVTYPNGAKEIGNATVANISAPGGAANEKGAISFEIHTNEIPKFTPAPVIP